MPNPNLTFLRVRQTSDGKISANKKFPRGRAAEKKIFFRGKNNPGNRAKNSWKKNFGSNKIFFGPEILRAGKLSRCLTRRKKISFSAYVPGPFKI